MGAGLRGGLNACETVKEGRKTRLIWSFTRALMVAGSGSSARRRRQGGRKGAVEEMAGELNAIECAKIRGGNHGVLKSFKCHQWRLGCFELSGPSKKKREGRARGGGAVVEMAGGEGGAGGRRW